jgi:hypothetical protein
VFTPEQQAAPLPYLKLSDLTRLEQKRLDSYEAEYKGVHEIAFNRTLWTAYRDISTSL